MKSLFNEQRGFTLIEIVIVIVIIGTLASVAMTKIHSYRQSVETATCIMNQQALETAQALYYADQAVETGVEKFAENDEDLLPFIKDGALPDCPTGGSYVLHDDGTVSCTDPAHTQRN